LVDLYGTLIEEPTWVCTGFANYMAKPIIANNWHKDMTEDQAKELLKECFKVLFYRDCGATDRIQFAVVTKDGARIEKPFQVDSKWDYKMARERANENILRQ